MTGGTPPPVQPRIAFDGDPAQIVRDEHGIARGGIRLPQVEVPLAHNSALQQAPDIFARLVGYHESFPVEKVRELYGDRERLSRPLRRSDAGGGERRRSFSPATSTHSWRRRPRPRSRCDRRSAAPGRSDGMSASPTSMPAESANCSTFFALSKVTRYTGPSA